MRQSLFRSVLSYTLLTALAPMALITVPLGWFLADETRFRSVIILASLLTATGLSVTLAILFAKRFTAPIRLLTDRAMLLTQGKAGVQIELPSPNELGQLAQVFNYASAQLLAYDNETRRLYQNLETCYLETMVLIANTIDRKDSLTNGHSQRVGDWASELGKQLGLPEIEIRHLLYGGLLHDVGKIGVIEPILGKRSALTDEEMKAMRAHPMIGASIIASVSFLKPVMPAVRSHHERWDGSGYPDGLKAEQIPRMARIIAVADTWDVLTSSRPYQKAVASEKALGLLRGLKAVLFDPQVVDALECLVRTKQARGERVSIAD